MPKVLATVVTYHPAEETVNNLRILLPQVDQIIVVDNASSESSRALIGQIDDPKVKLIPNLENLGVATAFNQGVRWGMENGFDLFLLMDQDSQPAEDMVGKLQSARNTLPQRGLLAMVGPHHIAIEKGPSAFNGPSLKRATLLITSGSLLGRDIIDTIGYYDDRLFIDHVDHDFCIRLQKAGGQMFVVTSAILRHRFGQGKLRSVFGKKLIITNYSPFRRYYMMRNRIILYKRYASPFKKWVWLELRFAVKDLSKLLLFENNKIEKLSSAFRGFRDGLFWQETPAFSKKDGQ